MNFRNLGKVFSMGVMGASLMVNAAHATAPNVTYTASGTFSNPQSSGSDTLKLAGEPFTISIVANAASTPIMHGPNWAVMSPFKMTGSVHSGLLGPTPINIVSTAASILQLVGPDYDIFITAFPVKVVGISLTIQATIYLPAGTITTPLIHPFNPVVLNPTDASVQYSNGTDTTVLSVDNGTLTATIPTGTNPTQASLTVPGSNSGSDRRQPDNVLPAEPAILVAFQNELVKRG